MKKIGIFEAKTRLSEICDEVARTQEPVTITRRGLELVLIEPVQRPRLSMKERRAAYMTAHGADETDDAKDFAPAARSREHSTFRLQE
jgi:prevent-host-death family protein